jgi:hypothetical protein
MKSKGIFIFIAVFAAIAGLLFMIGTSVEIIIFLGGFAMIILGIILLKKEITWRRNSDIVNGKVTKYHQYEDRTDVNRTGISIMYTMEVEYVTTSNKLIIAKEQSGSTSKKYPEGAEIKVRYSREDPSLFIVEGDNSRIYAMTAVMGMGAAIVALFGYILTSANS